MRNFSVTWAPRATSLGDQTQSFGAVIIFRRDSRSFDFFLLCLALFWVIAFPRPVHSDDDNFTTISLHNFPTLAHFLEPWPWAEISAIAAGGLVVVVVRDKGFRGPVGRP